MKILALDEIEHSHGTVHLIGGESALQHKKNSSIVLIPQPNRNDPNDPLNWSLPKRITALWSILLLSGLCNFCITGLAPAYEPLILEFGINTSQFTWLIAACLIGEFLGCYTIAPFAGYLGKRPLWLFCAVVFFVCNVWAAAAKSYVSLLLARFFASWAAGTSEPLSINTLNDIFFLHERGTQSGIQGTWLSLGSSLAPVICGFLIQAKGWRWYHWLVSILAGFDLILIFLFVPETNYRRDLHRAVDVAGVDQDDSPIEVEHITTPNEKMSAAHVVQQPTIQAPQPKKTFYQELNPISPIQRDVSLLGAFSRPWAVWAYPFLVWSILAFSTTVSCVVVLITMIPVYLGGPPYNFTIAQQGLVFLAPSVGNLIGAFFCGYLNDKLSQWSAKRNNGIFEPEMRLPVIIVPSLCVPIGMLMFGIGVSKEMHWAVPVIGDMFIGVGLTGLPSVIQPYLMDSYLPVIMDCLIAFNGFKNLISFAVGFAVVPWIKLDGTVAVFSILAGLVLFINSGAIILYLFGKRFRQQDAKKKLFIF